LFERMTAQLGQRTLRLRPAHGDFCDRNLVGRRNGIGVIDWSHFHPHTPPLTDLVNLLVARQSRGLALERPGRLLPLHRLDRNHWFGGCVDEILTQEAARSGLDGVDRSVVIGLPLAFSATRSLDEVGPRRSPLSRRAELFEDLALWAADS
jgi:hypothetical protein